MFSSIDASKETAVRAEESSPAFALQRCLCYLSVHFFLSPLSLTSAFKSPALVTRPSVFSPPHPRSGAHPLLSCPRTTLKVTVTRS